MANSAQTKLDIKALIAQLNQLTLLPEQEQSFTTSLTKADVLYKLATVAKQPKEQEHFLMQAISLLEGLSIMALQEPNLENTEGQKTESMEEPTPKQTSEQMDEKTFITMQKTLAEYYILLAQIKQDPKFYNVSKKLLRKHCKNGDVAILKQLIRVCAYKNEPALCQFYIKKIQQLPDFKPELLTQMSALEQYQDQAWHQELLTSLIYH